MASALLTRHPRTATTDVDRARHEVATTFCEHRLELTRRGSHLDMVHNAAAIGRDVVLNYLRYGSEVRITPGTFDDFYLLQVPLAGTARVRMGDQVVSSDRRHASLGSATEPVDMVWSDDCEQLLVYLRRSAVEEMAATEPGETPTVVFDPMVDLDGGGVRDWMRLVRLAVDDLEAGGAVFGSELVSSHYEQALIAGLLAAQPNSSRESAPSAEPGSRAVRTAVDLIEGSPERPWRVGELAERAGVSVRTLQEAFRRDLGRTPLEHLRRTRLTCARRSLLDADPTETTVTEVATRWGFFHPGRFAQTYRELHQESPSQTLAR